MEQSKIINVDIDINIKETNVRNLDAVFFSRDVNAAKIRFNITKDGEKLSDSTSASLLITSSNYWGALKDGLNIKLNETVKDGEVTFELPNDILVYEGFVRADLYIYWADGSNDGAQPILFSVKRSALDSTASTMSVVYVDEFEVEKARVTKAADDAIGTIDATPSKLDSSITSARNAISNSVSDVSNAETNAIRQINSDVSAVDSAKGTAIDKINSQTDLSTDIANAQKSMADTVSSVQNLGSTQSTAINAVLPTLQSQISDTQANAQTIKDQLESSTALTGIKTAWSNSADGTVDFTTVYPNLNLLEGTKDFSGVGWVNFNPLVVTENYKGLSVFPKTEQWNGVYKRCTIPEDGDYVFSVYISASADGLNPAMVIYKNGAIIKNTVLSTKMFAMQRFDYVSKNLKKGDVVFGKIDKSGTAAGKVSVAGHKWEKGSVGTLWMPHESEVTSKDYPTHRGIGVLDSTDRMDYQWEQSDTYRDHKEQQLKTAIIALGGSL